MIGGRGRRDKGPVVCMGRRFDVADRVIAGAGPLLVLPQVGAAGGPLLR